MEKYNALEGGGWGSLAWLPSLRPIFTLGSQWCLCSSDDALPVTEGGVSGTRWASGSPTQRRREEPPTCPSLAKGTKEDVESASRCSGLLLLRSLAALFYWVPFPRDCFLPGVAQQDRVTPCWSRAEERWFSLGQTLHLEAHFLCDLVLPPLARMWRPRSSH